MEFGGFPAWLLNEPGRMRSNNPTYLKHVAEYYDVLMEKIVPHQLANGGNILMIQIENEYGSFGEEKAYLRAIRDLMIAWRDSTIFTSDGHGAQRSSGMIEDDILVTGNFGSKAKENFGMMQAFLKNMVKMAVNVYGILGYGLIVGKSQLLNEIRKNWLNQLEKH